MNFEPIIGLEIHVQLKTKSKMFCSSPNNPDATEPNVNICEVCTGQPGVLPVANKEAIRKGIMVGLALNCEIPEYSKFDRKNYFYPDLPKGYQISQYDQPIAIRGQVKVARPLHPFSLSSPGGEGRGEEGERIIRITRAHLEEDAGKLIHEGNSTLVDFNRAGVPLVEIVTEPDLRSPGEAKAFLQNLRNIVRYLGVSDADMEKGHLRCDANISLRIIARLPDGQGKSELPDYKIEIKNLNSFKAVESGLNYEIQRQTEALEAGEKLKNETRGWDEFGNLTVPQRGKEEAHDYRYFPEPDLPVLHFTKEFVEKLRAELPELPEQKQKRFMSEFELSQKDAEVLISDKNLASYFEEVVSELQEWMRELPPTPSFPPKEDPPLAETKEGEGGVPEGVHPSISLRAGKFAKLASNWITGDFQALLKGANLSPQESRVTAENLAELIKMVDRGEVSTTAGKRVLQIMFEKGGDPSNIVEDEGIAQVSDEQAIAAAADKVIAENAKAAADYRAGKKESLGFLVGKVMAEMKGQANPQMVNKILEKKLANS